MAPCIGICKNGTPCAFKAKFGFTVCRRHLDQGDEIVFDQKVNTWIQCHINAFNYFQGVPKVIKLDNLKSAIIIANFYEPIMA